MNRRIDKAHCQLTARSLPGKIKEWRWATTSKYPLLIKRTCSWHCLVTAKNPPQPVWLNSLEEDEKGSCPSNSSRYNELHKLPAVVKEVVSTSIIRLPLAMGYSNAWLGRQTDLDLDLIYFHWSQCGARAPQVTEICRLTGCCLHNTG